ncbi:uncharacterized protein LOC128208182 [Mya arenaria]|uniref:uncharacterized protein LOC128208182 n=1 Tax=Mya arenaria TaxID=6604 RepID=UPI0022E007A4|nr:uncharacterized protein LOC128208182 [Mya arenaria]
MRSGNGAVSSVCRVTTVITQTVRSPTIHTLTECPTGHYCPNGTQTSNQHACPAGTYNYQTALTDASECTPCIGTTVANPTRCTTQYHCPEGSADPVECPADSYTSQRTQWECVSCPAGSYCIYDSVTTNKVNSVKFACPKGCYCPEGTGYEWQTCPNGTFSNSFSLIQQSECTDCLASKYCNTEGATAVTGDCNTGHWCQSGVDRGDPDNDADPSTYNATCGLGVILDMVAFVPRAHTVLRVQRYPLIAPLVGSRMKLDRP